MQLVEFMDAKSADMEDWLYIVKMLLKNLVTGRYGM